MPGVYINAAATSNEQSRPGYQPVQVRSLVRAGASVNGTTNSTCRHAGVPSHGALQVSTSIKDRAASGPRQGYDADDRAMSSSRTDEHIKRRAAQSPEPRNCQYASISPPPVSRDTAHPPTYLVRGESPGSPQNMRYKFIPDRQDSGSPMKRKRHVSSTGETASSPPHGHEYRQPPHPTRQSMDIRLPLYSPAAKGSNAIPTEPKRTSSGNHVKTSFNGLQDVPIGPRALIEAPPHIPLHLPHIFIAGTDLPTNPAMQRHLLGFLRDLKPDQIFTDAEGWYLMYEASSRGRGKLEACYETYHKDLLFREYLLHMCRRPFGDRDAGLDTKPETLRDSQSRAMDGATSQKIRPPTISPAMTEPKLGLVASKLNEQEASDPRLRPKQVSAQGSSPLTSPVTIETADSHPRTLPDDRRLSVAAHSDRDDSASSVSGRTLSTMSMSRRSRCHNCDNDFLPAFNDEVRCSTCSRKFHERCKRPTSTPHKNTWRCRSCLKKAGLYRTSGTGDTATPTSPTSSSGKVDENESSVKRMRLTTMRDTGLELQAPTDQPVQAAEPSVSFKLQQQPSLHSNTRGSVSNLCGTNEGEMGLLLSDDLAAHDLVENSFERLATPHNAMNKLADGCAATKPAKLNVGRKKVAPLWAADDRQPLQKDGLSSKAKEGKALPALLSFDKPGSPGVSDQIPNVRSAPLASARDKGALSHVSTLDASSERAMKLAPFAEKAAGSSASPEAMSLERQADNEVSLDARSGFQRAFEARKTTKEDDRLRTTQANLAFAVTLQQCGDLTVPESPEHVRSLPTDEAATQHAVANKYASFPLKYPTDEAEKEDTCRSTDVQTAIGKAASTRDLSIASLAADPSTTSRATRIAHPPNIKGGAGASTADGVMQREDSSGPPKRAKRSIRPSAQMLIPCARCKKRKVMQNPTGTNELCPPCRKAQSAEAQVPQGTSNPRDHGRKVLNQVNSNGQLTGPDAECSSIELVNATDEAPDHGKIAKSGEDPAEPAVVEERLVACETCAKRHWKCTHKTVQGRPVVRRDCLRRGMECPHSDIVPSPGPDDRDEGGQLRHSPTSQTQPIQEQPLSARDAIGPGKDSAEKTDALCSNCGAESCNCICGGVRGHSDAACDCSKPQKKCQHRNTPTKQNAAVGHRYAEELPSGHHARNGSSQDDSYDLEPPKESALVTTASDLAKTIAHSGTMTVPKLKARKSRKSASSCMGKEASINKNLGDSFERPKGTYFTLIGMALRDSPGHRLRTKGVQKWIADHIPGYKAKEGTWERGIGCTLIMYTKDHGNTKDFFEKVLPQDGEQGEGSSICYRLIDGVPETSCCWDPVLEEPVSPPRSESSTSVAKPDVQIPPAMHLASTLDTQEKETVSESPTHKPARKPPSNLNAPKALTPPGASTGDATSTIAPSSVTELEAQTRMGEVITNTLAGNKMAMDDSSDSEPIARKRRRLNRRVGPIETTGRVNAAPTATIVPTATKAGRITAAVPSSQPHQLADQLGIAAAARLTHSAVPQHALPNLLKPVVEDRMDVDAVLSAASKLRADKLALPLTQERLKVAELIKLEAGNIQYRARSLFGAWPEYHPDNYFDKARRIAEIRQRPSRKQLFGDAALRSRLKSKEAAKVLLASDTSFSQSNRSTASPEKRANWTPLDFTVNSFPWESENAEANRKHFDTLAEFLDLPESPMPILHDKQLAYRDGTRAENGDLPRLKLVYKVGTQA